MFPLSSHRFGLLVMAYGSPKDRQDILRYYTDIRRGRPPTPEQLAELTARYEAIGGTSPLAAITVAQAEGTAAELNRRDLGAVFQAFVGLRHSPPFIADAVEAMVAAGIRQGIALVLAPHYSRMSVGAYWAQAEAALERLGWPLQLRPIRQWHDHPSYIAFLVKRLRAAEAALELPRAAIAYIFTAHSLPARIVAEGDPYPEQLNETARAVARAVHLPNHRVAWQSRGRTEEDWLGPDILEVLEAVARQGLEGALVIPCGFVSDHLEVLYDLDIEAKRTASALGLRFARTAMGNADPEFLAVLADVVADAYRNTASVSAASR